MGRKFKIGYVRIKNNYGKSRQVPLRRALSRKVTPLRRYLLKDDALVVRKTRRRSNISRGLATLKVTKN